MQHIDYDDEGRHIYIYIYDDDDDEGRKVPLDVMGLFIVQWRKRVEDLEQRERAEASRMREHFQEQLTR